MRLKYVDARTPFSCSFFFLKRNRRLNEINASIEVSKGFLEAFVLVMLYFFDDEPLRVNTSLKAMKLIRKDMLSFGVIIYIPEPLPQVLVICGYNE